MHKIRNVALEQDQEKKHAQDFRVFGTQMSIIGILVRNSELEGIAVDVANHIWGFLVKRIQLVLTVI